MDYEQKIKTLALRLPPAPKPVGAYQPFVITGGKAYLSGQISKDTDGAVLTGKAGRDLSLEGARAAARAAALGVLSIIRDGVGFERFERLIRVVGYVQAADDFYQVADVMNAASNLFLDVFGENGAHARSAAGVPVLPLNAAVEIEVTVQLKSSSVGP